MSSGPLMTAILDYFRLLGSRQVVRPWALAAPVILLLIALPLLRPLRSPGDPSLQELSRLATVQALVEHDSLAINDTEFFAALRRGEGSDEDPAHIASADAVPGTIHVGPRYYSDRPPVLSYLLSAAYWVLYRLGWEFKHNRTLVTYILTMLASTIPAAFGAGLVYRMSRIFELRRPWRAALSLAVGLASGLISYATVLNPHVPAAALLLGTAACLLHVNSSKAPARCGGWLALAGLCAALAAVIDLSALIFLALLPPFILALRWKWPLRIGGVLLFAIGATPPLLLHAALTLPVTGDLRPGFLHSELGEYRAFVPVISDEIEEASRPAPWKAALFKSVDRALGAIVGSKGLLSHFPIVIVGMIGVGLVLRRHWPAPIKLLAAATLLGSIAIVGIYVTSRADWKQAMFGPRWFIVFLPLMLFWAGAFLRKSHGPITWAAVSLLLLFSMGVSIIGAAAPFVRSEPGQYTVLAAYKKMRHPEVIKHPKVQVVVGR